MATQKIAVAVVHGVGSQKADFANAFEDRLKARFAEEIDGMTSDPLHELETTGVHWGKVLSDEQDTLKGRLASSDLDWDRARDVMIDLGGDALAYQINRQASPTDPPGTYEKIHMVFAEELLRLAQRTGSEAPLAIVSHSLGSVITSNYLWDLQLVDGVAAPVLKKQGGMPLERGKTLVGLYTMGSPIAIWSLRFEDFGRPIAFPVPDRLERYRELPAEWVNMYDPDDVIGYPLKVVNDMYDANVTEDLAVNVGNVLKMWNPASHTEYWLDGGVVARVAEGLVRVWRQLNTPAG